MEYLGFDVLAQGVQPSPEKVRTIVEWPRPQSIKDVRSFLGLAGFHRRFIKQFSLKARPLTDLTKDKITWQWTDKEENAFCNLKRSLLIAPVLRMPNFDLSFVVTTDSSLVFVGAIFVEYAKVVGPADRHSVKSCALLSMITSDAAFDSTIPSQCNLVLKIRVLFFVLLPTARPETSRQVALTMRCSHTSASPPK